MKKEKYLSAEFSALLLYFDFMYDKIFIVEYRLMEVLNEQAHEKENKQSDLKKDKKLDQFNLSIAEPWDDECKGCEHNTACGRLFAEEALCLSKTLHS